MICRRCGRVDEDGRNAGRWRISLVTGATVCPSCATPADRPPRWRVLGDLTEADPVTVTVKLDELRPNPVTLNDETLATFDPATFDSAIELAEQCRFYVASAASSGCARLAS